MTCCHRGCAEGMVGKELSEMTTERAQRDCANSLVTPVLHCNWVLWIFAINFHIFLSFDLYTLCCMSTDFPKTAETFKLVEIITTERLTKRSLNLLSFFVCVLSSLQFTCTANTILLWPPPEYTKRPFFPYSSWLGLSGDWCKIANGHVFYKRISKNVVAPRKGCQRPRTFSKTCDSYEKSSSVNLFRATFLAEKNTCCHTWKKILLHKTA